MSRTITLTYSSYARASKVFEYFTAEGDAAGMCKDRKTGKWKIIIAA